LQRIRDVLFGDAELGKFGAHRIGAGNAHWRQYDTAVFRHDVEVFASGNSLSMALGIVSWFLDVILASIETE
jgi:hypothetical protein